MIEEGNGPEGEGWSNGAMLRPMDLRDEFQTMATVDMNTLDLEERIRALQSREGIWVTVEANADSWWLLQWQLQHVAKTLDVPLGTDEQSIVNIDADQIKKAHFEAIEKLATDGKLTSYVLPPGPSTDASRC